VNVPRNLLNLPNGQLILLREHEAGGEDGVHHYRLLLLLNEVKIFRKLHRNCFKVLVVHLRFQILNSALSHIIVVNVVIKVDWLGVFDHAFSELAFFV
jgi:hypothetical protein